MQSRKTPSLQGKPYEARSIATTEATSLRAIGRKRTSPSNLVESTSALTASRTLLPEGQFTGASSAIVIAPMHHGRAFASPQAAPRSNVVSASTRSAHALRFSPGLRSK